MLPRFFANKSQTITGAAIILGAASLASRLLGLVRDRVLAHYFGAGEIIDAYYAAFKIPDLVYVLLIAGALTVAFIPPFTKLYLKDEKSAWRFANNVLNVSGLFMVAVVAVLMIIAPLLAPIVAPGFGQAKREMVVVFSRIMFLSPLLLGFSAIAGGVLQSLKNFLIYSLSPIFYNLGIIFGALALVPVLGESGLAWGVILGAGLHLLIQMPALFQAGFRFSFVFDLKDKTLRLMSRLIGPRILALAALQINLIVITAIASILPAGSVAIFNYANNLQSLPYGLIGVSFAVAAFPAVSALAAKNKKRELVENFSSVARQILFFTIPLSVLFLMLRAQIVRVVLGSGAFGWDATVRTADSLAFFSLSLFAQAMTPLLVRVFYALEDTKTPFLIAGTSVSANIVLSWFLTRPGFLWGLGVEGLALAYTVSSIMNFSLLWIFLRLRLGSLDEGRILPAVYKISVSALAAGVAVQLLKSSIAPMVDMQTFRGIFLQGLGAGAGGLAVYAAMGLALKSHEMKVLAETVKKRLIKTKNLPADISEIGRN